MNLRTAKKKGFLLQKKIKRKKLIIYKKGWNSFENHHVTARINGGSNSNYNKIIIAGKIHYCWHQIFGNLDPQDAKLFVVFLLLGSKNKWKIKEIRRLEQFIKSHNIVNAKKLSKYLMDEKKELYSLKEKSIFNLCENTLLNKKINDRFYWCWNELFAELSLYKIQIFISILFAKIKGRWNLKRVRAMREAVNDNYFQRATSIAGLNMNFSSFIYVEKRLDMNKLDKVA